ncbi:MAG: efflux RND transporter periplasmic adaptor subunit, partial [Acidobacteriota bacterium]
MAENGKSRLAELSIDADDRDGGRGGKVVVAIAALVLVALAVAAFFWFRQQAPTEVRVATVESEGGRAAATAGAVLEATGYVTPRRRATVSSKVTGKIREVLIEEGMEVADDEIVATLDDSLERRRWELARAQLGEARSNLAEIEVRIREAELDLNRARELVAADVSSQADLDAAQAAYDALVARLANAKDDVKVAEESVALSKTQLDDMVIRAPFGGVVVTKDAQPGEMISPVSAGGGFTRTGIGTIVDMASLEIEVDVNEAYIDRVRPGQGVVATLDAYPQWQIPATVILPVPTADRQKATVMVRIGFDQLDPRILPDMGVKVSFLEVGAETQLVVG